MPSELYQTFLPHLNQQRNYECIERTCVWQAGYFEINIHILSPYFEKLMANVNSLKRLELSDKKIT